MFHEEKLGTAVLVTAQGIGAVCMGLTHRGALRPVRHTPRAARRCSVALPVALIAVRPRAHLPLAVVAIFVVGALYLGSLSSFTTVAQLRAPAELRGRVVSVLMMLLGALYPLGSIAQGAIADEIGLRATTTDAPRCCGSLLLGVWRLLRPAHPTRSATPSRPRRSATTW